MSVVGYFQPMAWKKKAHNVSAFPRFLWLVGMLVAEGLPNDRRLTVVGAENRSRSGRAVSEFLSIQRCAYVWRTTHHSPTHSLTHSLSLVHSVSVLSVVMFRALVVVVVVLCVRLELTRGDDRDDTFVTGE